MLPSLFILIALSLGLPALAATCRLVAGVFYGIKPAVTALVLHAARRIGTRALKQPLAVGRSRSPRSSRSSRSALPFPAIVVAAGVDRLLSAAGWRRGVRARRRATAAAAARLRRRR
ncbi:MAG: hypothetical protein MZW92_74625 [Comamonadaceae bacterium]|nr:hypothetical protein [Comamonadaceae bacterium]